MVVALTPESITSPDTGDVIIVLLASIIIGSQMSAINRRSSNVKRSAAPSKKEIEEEIIDLINTPIQQAIERQSREGEFIVFDYEPTSSNDLELLSEIQNAVRNDGVEVLLQPVVSLPQQKPRYYECFSRIVTRGGMRLEPDDYIRVAEDAGIISAIDNLLLFKCIQLVKKVRKADGYIGFFCNISEKTLANSEFMQRLIRYFEQNPQLKPWIFFEIKEGVAFSMDPEVKQNLRSLIDMKCHISLDQLDSLTLDTDWLQSMGVRFIKVNSRALKAESLEAINKLSSARQSLNNLKIDVIIAKIESEPDLQKALHFNIDFGQGYLLGKPMVSKF